MKTVFLLSYVSYFLPSNILYSSFTSVDCLSKWLSRQKVALKTIWFLLVVGRAVGKIVLRASFILVY